MLLKFMIYTILIRISQATDYCLVCPNGAHTMCLYPEGPGPNCLEYRQVMFNENLKQYIVDIHNDIRNHVASGQEIKGKLGPQPPAADMMQMEWDDELATIAQRWADQCISINGTPQHDICKVTNKFDKIGQNILTAVTNGTELPELALLILNWYKQVSSVIPSDVDFFSGIKRGQFLIGQYTQLVWANTRYVGCGMAIYKEQNSLYFDQRLVCNYGPGGNIIGKPIYIKGPPCSRCPTGQCDSFRTALCAGHNMSPIWSTSNITSQKFTSLLNQQLKLCVRIPYDTMRNMNNCSFSSNTNGSRDYLENDVDMVIFGNISLRGHLEITDTFLDTVLHNDTYSLNFQPELVINLTKNDYFLSLMKNENYTNLMKTLYLYLGNMDLGMQVEGQNESTVGEKEVRTKRAVGKWYNGRCHCDKIYRNEYKLNTKGHDDTSGSNLVLPVGYVFIFILIFLK